MGIGRVGFLRGQPPQARAFNIICGTSKRKREEEGPKEVRKKPKSGGRPITTMMVHLGQKSWQAQVLLDTGYTIPLMNREFAGRNQIPLLKHDQVTPLYNFTGDIVAEAGQFFTRPVILQHRKHFTNETFEISPLEPGVDLFLPFWWIAKHPPQGAWDSKELRFTHQSCLENCQRGQAEDFPITLDEEVATNEQARIIGYISAVSSDEDPIQLVPTPFREFLGIMGKEAAERLPDHRQYDCKIDLKEGESPPWGPLYPLSENELEVLREWLKEMLRTGKIQRSTSSVGAPILFVPKPSGRGLRLCVDYRGINRITIPNRYPLPLMQELQDRVRGATMFTKLDLKSGFALIRMKEGDEWKTAFRTRYGLYEFNIMPFGLTNAPATFQDMMNYTFSDMLDLGLIIYMDDILIYAETEEKHEKIVMEVLKRLTDNHLAIEPAKCVWKAEEVEFLGYMIGINGVRMAKDKVELVLEWRQPTSLTETQSFLGFANFYRRCIQNYSRMA
jgi:hypothetical protein